MKVLVLGATGATGRLIVSKAVEQGYQVVALVRSKAKAIDLAGAELVEGDARDVAALTRAIAGCDAVISSLGTPMSPFREVTLLSTATRALVGVMATRTSGGWCASPALAPATAVAMAAFFLTGYFCP